MLEILHREYVYISYYFLLQLKQIAFYWILGMVIGSLVSVFFKDRIHTLFGKLDDKKLGIWGIIPAAILGILSPLCMYGTIPIAASFSRNGMREDFLAVFMMTSILLNPQLIIYSSSLGITVLLVRIISALVCGIVFGLLINAFFKNKSFFNFSGFQSPRNNDTDANILKRFLFNLGRNIKKTAPYFLVGVLLSALFQRYIPAEYFASLFGKTNEGFGLLLASTIGVPLYACGGGTIPLLKEWLVMGMSVGSAAAFMITGPATKITNLGALKIVLGVKNFILYIIFIITFSIMTGFIVNLII